MKELFSDKLKVKLKKHFKDGLSENLEEIIKEARDDEEGKKLNALRREKR